MKKSKISAQGGSASGGKTQNSKSPTGRPSAFPPGRGFSMIETLLAVFVIVVGVLGAFGVIVKSLTVSPVVRQDLVAARLAEEGIEMVRNIRDGSLLKIADKMKQGGVPNPSCVTAGAEDCSGDRWDENLIADATGTDCSSGPNATSTRRLTLANNSNFAAGMALQCPVVTGNPNKDTTILCQSNTTGLYATRSSSGGGGGNPCPPSGSWTKTPFRRQIDIAFSSDGTTFVWGADVSDCSRSATACAVARVRVYVWWTGADLPPSTCPGPMCIMLEDRLTDWTDYMQSFL